MKKILRAHLLASSSKAPLLLSPARIPSFLFLNFCPSPIGVTIPCPSRPSPEPVCHPIFSSIFIPIEPDEASRAKWTDSDFESLGFEEALPAGFGGAGRKDRFSRGGGGGGAVSSPAA
jgi:hypothetical protein